MTNKERHLQTLPDFMLEAYNALPEGEHKAECDAYLSRLETDYLQDEFAVIVLRSE